MQQLPSRGRTLRGLTPLMMAAAASSHSKELSATLVEANAEVRPQKPAKIPFFFLKKIMDDMDGWSPNGDDFQDFSEHLDGFWKIAFLMFDSWMVGNGDNWGTGYTPKSMFFRG